MNSSGIKRGLATTAIAALAITGVPAIANAVPLSSVAGGADQVILYAPDVVNVSTANDGTNTTVSLLAGAGADVASVVFQYQTTASAGAWIDVPGGNVARGADGAFGVDWSNIPTDLLAVRVVGAGAGDIDSQTATFLANTATVELDTEGSLGVFQAPYTEVGRDGDYVGVTGTTSGTAVTVEDRSNTTAGGSTSATVGTPANGVSQFSAVYDASGYQYSGGNEANQIVMGAETGTTDDAEASTLYVQTIGQITARSTNTSVILTVTDTQGQPVAGAQIFQADNATTPTTGTLVGYTNGLGQFEDTTPPAAGTAAAYYVNANDNDNYDAAVDKIVNVNRVTPVATAVQIVNVRNRAAFDIDEFNDADDFAIVVRDQAGDPLQETAGVEYRYVIDPTAAGAATQTSNWIPLTTTNGRAAVPALTNLQYANTAVFPGNTAGAVLPAGSYTLEARRPNVNGTGLVNATPLTVSAAESEIDFADGNNANATVNGEFTVTGTLALTDAAETGLAGRSVDIDYPTVLGESDSRIAPQAQQPAGVTVIDGQNATVITGTGGSFSIVLTDPDVPTGVTPRAESRTLTATAFEAAGDPTSLQGDNGQSDSPFPNDDANAAESLEVNFQQAAVVKRIDVDTSSVFFGDVAPGKPVEINVTVFGEGPTASDNDDVVLNDYPVAFSADKGFFTTDTVDGVGNLDPEDLVLDADNDDEGDLFGFYEDLGDEETVDTDESGNGAGIVAAIEDDADFDDDGLAEMTVTVTAGGVSEDVEVTFDSSDYLNLGNVTLERADGGTGDVTVGDEVPFSLTAEDQFGNLVREIARVTDDTPLADVTTDGDFGDTETDFENDNAGIIATSDNEVVQTLMARIAGVSEVLVDEDEDPDFGTRTVTESAAPLTWVADEEPPVIEKETIRANLSANNNGAKDDRLKVTTGKAAAAGAVVKFFRIKANGSSVQVGQTVLDEMGAAKQNVNDVNGKKFSRYFARVLPTELTKSDRSNNTRVR